MGVRKDVWKHGGIDETRREQRRKKGGKFRGDMDEKMQM